MIAATTASTTRQRCSPTWRSAASAERSAGERPGRAVLALATGRPPACSSLLFFLAAFAAAFAFLLLPFLLHLLGGGAVTEAETRRLLGSGELDLAGYFLLAAIVFVVAALCMITSRVGVIRVLRSYA